MYNQIARSPNGIRKAPPYREPTLTNGPERKSSHAIYESHIQPLEYCQYPAAPLAAAKREIPQLRRQMERRRQSEAAAPAACKTLANRRAMQSAATLCMA